MKRTWQIELHNAYRVEGNIIRVYGGLWRYPRRLIREFVS